MMLFIRTFQGSVIIGEIRKSGFGASIGREQGGRLLLNRRRNFAAADVDSSCAHSSVTENLGSGHGGGDEQ